MVFWIQIFEIVRIVYFDLLHSGLPIHIVLFNQYYTNGSIALLLGYTRLITIEIRAEITKVCIMGL